MREVDGNDHGIVCKLQRWAKMTSWLHVLNFKSLLHECFLLTLQVYSFVLSFAVELHSVRVWNKKKSSCGRFHHFSLARTSILSIALPRQKLEQCWLWSPCWSTSVACLKNTIGTVWLVSSGYDCKRGAISTAIQQWLTIFSMLLIQSWMSSLQSSSCSRKSGSCLA